MVLFCFLVQLLLSLQIIQWSKDIFLRWSDFKAESNPAAYEDAFSTIKYRITWTVDSVSQKDQILFFINDLRLAVEFFPYLSWVRQMYATPELLRHEQGHFDLAEMLRPEITNKIKDVVSGQRHVAEGQNDEQRKQFARENSASLLMHELQKWQTLMEKKRSEYSKETGFGHNAEMQLRYDIQFSHLRT